MMTGDPDNPGWLEDAWDEALHQARCLKDFGHWLRTPPGRRKLFAAYCRHAAPDQWDRFLASGEPPFIFPSREKLDAHLEHCQLCGAQLQLAELRRRPTSRIGEADERSVLEVYETFCNEALAAVCDPAEWAPDASAVPPRVWRESPPCRIAASEASVPALGRSEIPLRLLGPTQPGRIEICVSGQLIRGADRQAAPLVFLFAGSEGEPQPIEWRPDQDGVMSFPLPPAEPATAGRLILRYAVRPLPDDPAIPAETAVGALTLEISERP